ncbi:hypothetical protein N7539_006643, partial [Penicillium diatomitis]
RVFGTKAQIVQQSFNQDGSLTIDMHRSVTCTVVRAKFDMGLFEDLFPAASPEDWPNLIHADEALQIATQLDRESIVLLENPGQALPLGESVQRIAVIGPFADVLNEVFKYDDYTFSPPPGVSPLEGIGRTISTSVQVYHARYCDAWSNDESQIAEALRLARFSDVVVVVVGTCVRSLLDQQKGLKATTGEAYDTNALKLAGAQSTLLRQLIRTGVKTVVVFSGKSITEPWISQINAALLQPFYTSRERWPSTGRGSIRSLQSEWTAASDIPTRHRESARHIRLLEVRP